MGNGPGALAEYMELFTRHPRCAGGFVWEWIDHCFPRPDGSWGYGGDFGEVVHDGTFIADGLLFPDRTPSPGLIELKKVYEPVGISGGVGGVRVENRFLFRDLAHLRFPWTYDVAGEQAAAGEFRVGALPAGAVADLELPALPEVRGEAWLTVRAVLAADEPWARAGHEVAWGQVPIVPPAPVELPSRLAAAHGRAPAVADDVIEFGPGVFDRTSGKLLRLGDVTLDGVRADAWRAPTDNDEPALGAIWRAHGLDRLTHRTLSVRHDVRGVIVRTRVAAAATDESLGAVFTWRLAGEGLELTVELTPDRRWDFPLPRLGVRFSVPRTDDRVEWFGRGPGEAYPDSRLAARVGRFASSVGDLQTPYVRPQENGNRTETRWACFGGLRIEGRPLFDFTVRPWSPEALTAAAHTTDLVPSDRLWVNLDAALHGLGSASCGPDVLPGYRLEPRAASLRVWLSPA
jgi:beta-galactosidase